MKRIIDCTDGSVEIVELNDLDLKQQQIDSAKIIAEEKIAKQIADKAAAAKADLLERLGITAEEAKLLLG